jgi:hypothetical protein
MTRSRGSLDLMAESSEPIEQTVRLRRRATGSEIIRAVKDAY